MTDAVAPVRVSPNVRAETAELADVLKHLDLKFYESVHRAAAVLREAFARGGKALICGNGGSAAEAQHFSDEMLGRYRANRTSYPALALTADAAALTCIANDFGYEYVFSRQVEALGQRGDVFISLSTSGNSPNVLRAAAVARERGLTVVALTGATGQLRAVADIAIEAPSASTARMQEVHLHAIHLLSEYFEPTSREVVPAKAGTGFPPSRE